MEPVGEIDWSARYAASGDAPLAEFCAVMGTTQAPLCQRLQAPCTGFTVTQCLEVGEPSAPVATANSEVDRGWGFTSWWAWIVSAAFAAWAVLERVNLSKAKQSIEALRAFAEQFRNFLRDVLDDQSHAIVRQELTVAAETNVVLLGAGGTGKTSIVRALAAMSKANPAISTGEVELYALASDVAVLVQEEVESGGTAAPQVVNVKLKTRVKLNVLDTVGQRPEQLVTTGLLRNNSPTIVVLVVDLFRSTNGVVSQQAKGAIEKKRIAEQLALWNPAHLKALLANGHLGRIAGFVVFVNKVDLLDVKLSEAMTEARSEGRKFAESILSVAHVAAPPVVVGSAALGWGVSGFRDNNHQDVNYETLLEHIIRIAKEHS